jgi:hypothetical protein
VKTLISASGTTVMTRKRDVSGSLKTIDMPDTKEQADEICEGYPLLQKFVGWHLPSDLTQGLCF